MKKAILTSMFIAGCVAVSMADTIVDDVTIDNFTAERNGNYLSLNMDMGLKNLDVSSNQCVLLMPRLVNGNDSISLPAVAIYGRRRYYYYKRNNGDDMLSGNKEITYMAKDKPATVDYHELFPFEEWMDGAKVSLQRIDRGCCSKELFRDYGIIGSYREAFFPELVYIHPTGEREKRRTLEGQAFIDFPVDETIIYNDYRDNFNELGKIQRTIDTIRYDRDARIDTVWLKGFASPESPYRHNTELAIGRTAALKDYLNKIYDFSDVKMLTDYEPEDWAGLRRFVEKSNLEHRKEILALIDSNMEPDAKEARIRKLYPEEYDFMHKNYYPALRHTDYKVSYVIRTYSDPKEILTVMKEHPQKLDQNEFYVAASEFEPGTDEFTDVFETAVRMYPTDSIANLNAANAALRRGDIAGAERYVTKAGNSPEAIYTRGAIAIRKKDYATARTYLKEAEKAGLKQAAVTLRELNSRTNYKDPEDK